MTRMFDPALNGRLIRFLYKANKSITALARLRVCFPPLNSVSYRLAASKCVCVAAKVAGAQSLLR